MFDTSGSQRTDRVMRCLLGAVGLHSCVLGALMLFLPHLMLKTLGFTGDVPLFFPSQSGIFLLILGICYVYAVVQPEVLMVALLSKALAFVFLLAHAAFLAAPSIIWAAAAGDGAMLLALGVGATRSPRYRMALLPRKIKR